MLILPPASESELLERANTLAGKTLGEIAFLRGQPVPTTLHRAKGWMGQLIESTLGANAGNLDQPDFVNLGIELKTLPVLSQGEPTESTYICKAAIPNTDPDFYHSRVWRKMAKILWMPIEATPHIPIAQRRVGTPILWTPSLIIQQDLQQDWEEIIELITLGHFDEISAHKGKYLQLRPKAAHSKTFIQVVNQYGETISTVPKGFYIRPLLTQHILKTAYF